MSEFSKNLKKARIKAGYSTAKDFAKELGMKYTTYVAYENRNREATYDVLIKIAKKLNTTANELLGMTTEGEYEKGFRDGVSEACHRMERKIVGIRSSLTMNKS